jgi:filamentous hemagglutinin family protein
MLWNQRVWFWLVPLVSGGLTGSGVNAQIIPDNSTGSTIRSGIAVQGLSADIIEGGTIRNSNLFHSFQEFNIDTDRGVYFLNPVGVTNILTRVTGNNVSILDGTLGVLGDANLFLLNPSGLIFGPRSRLDLNGSFLGSTAESVLFDNYEFSVENVDTPPLLTISIPSGLQFGENPGDIIVQSQAQNLLTSEPFTAAEDAGQLLSSSLALNDEVTPLSGLILGELSSPTDVDLYQIFLKEGTTFSAATEGNINTALFLFDSNGLGIIGNDDLGDQVSQSRLPSQTITTSGIYYLGVASSLNLPFSIEGLVFSEGFGVRDLRPNGTGANSPLVGWTPLLPNPSGGLYSLFLQVLEAGDTGALTVPSSQTLTLIGGDVKFESGRIYAPGATLQVVGVGQQGSIALNSDLTAELPSDISRGEIQLLERSSLEVLGEGGGRIDVVAQSLKLQERSAIVGGISSDSLSPSASAGDVIITVHDNITISGGSWIENLNANGLGNAGKVNISAGDITLLDSAIGASSFGQGNAGDILIDALSLSLLDGGILNASTYTQGNAGRIEVRSAGAVTMKGRQQRPENTGLQSLITSQVLPLAQGRSQGILIEAGSLLLDDGATIASVTTGTGDSGAVEVYVDGDILITGMSEVPNRLTGMVGASAIGSFVLSTSGGTEGSSGTVTLEADNLTLADGAQVLATVITTSGVNVASSGELPLVATGDAGAITIRVRNDITIAGASEDGRPSAINSQVEAGATGEAQNIIIEAISLTLSEGAQITAEIEGQGNAGSIVIDAVEEVRLGQGTLLTVESSGSGQPGNITVTTPSLSIEENAQLSATVTEMSTNTEGGGDITINSSSLDISGQLGIFAETNSIAPAGNLNLRPNGTDGNLSILFRDRGFISASTTAQGSGGNITLQAPETLDIRGQGRISVETSGVGDAGTITLDAQTVNISDGTQITASSSSSGSAGTINITADQVNLSTGAAITTETSSDQGNISIQARKLLTLASQARITTNATNTATGGNINIDTGFLIGRPGQNTDITANASQGSGGLIRIKADGILGFAVRTRDDLISLLGTSDPDQLDPTRLPSNDITAFSQARPDIDVGTVQIQTPETDATKSLAKLPETLLDVSTLLDDRCAAAPGNHFTTAGRGGLPLSPYDTLQDETGLLAQQGILVATALPADTNNALATPSVFAQVHHLQQQGLHRRSLVLLAPLMQQLEAEPDSQVKAIALRQYGTALRSVGSLDQSRQYLEQAFSLAQTLDSPDDTAAAALSLGNTLLALGDPAQALTSYQNAATLTQAPTLRLQALVNQYRIEVEQQQRSSLPALQSEINTLLPYAPPASPASIAVSTTLMPSCKP